MGKVELGRRVAVRRAGRDGDGGRKGSRARNDEEENSG